MDGFGELGNIFENMENNMNSCLKVFVFITKNFSTDSLMKRYMYEALIESLTKPSCKDKVVPVKTKEGVEIYGLESLKQIKYYSTMEKEDPDKEDLKKALKTIVSKRRKVAKEEGMYKQNSEFQLTIILTHMTRKG